VAETLAVAALALAVSLLDLLLILGIVRRLRWQAVLPSPHEGPGVFDMGSGLLAEVGCPSSPPRR
jgi:hypothetical protein